MCNDSSYKLNSFLTTPASSPHACFGIQIDPRQRRTAYSLVDQECALTQTFTLILRAKGYDHQQQHPSTIFHLLAAGRHYEDDYKDDEMIPRRVTLSSSPQDDGNWIFTKLALCHPRRSSSINPNVPTTAAAALLLRTYRYVWCPEDNFHIKDRQGWLTIIIWTSSHVHHTDSSQGKRQRQRKG